jgi:hypothetical protein
MKDHAKRLRAIACSILAFLNVAETVVFSAASIRGAAAAAVSFAAMERAFGQNASQNGQSVGTSLLGIGASAISPTNPAPNGSAGKTALGSMGSVSQQDMQQAQGVFGNASVGRNDQGIHNWAITQQARLTDPVCTWVGQTSALSNLQTSVLPALQQAQSVCEPVGKAISASAQSLIHSLSNSPSDTSLRLTLQGLSGEASALSNAAEGGVSITNDWIDKYARVPYCNIINPADMNSAANTLISAANNLKTVCQSASPAITAANASSLLSQVKGATSNFQQALRSDSIQAVKASMNHVSAYRAMTVNGTVGIEQLMGNPTGGAVKGLKNNTGNPLVNVLANPANAPLVSSLGKLLQNINPQLTNVFFGCTEQQQTFATTGGPGSQVSTQSVLNPKEDQTGGATTACVYQGTPPGAPLVPDTHAAWVYIPAVPGQCTGAMANGTLMFSLENQFSGQDLKLVLSVAGTQGATATASPNQGTPATVTAAAGTMARGNVTISPTSANQAVITGMSVTTNGGAVWVSLDNYTTHFAGTDGRWSTAPTVQTVKKTPAGTAQTYDVKTPDAVQTSVQCQAAVQCLGTQCHSLMGTQDPNFGQAAGQLSAMQQLAQNACCAPGTSVGAGTCEPLIFCGKTSSCRTFLGSGWLTNNCCDAPNAKITPLAALLKVATIAYAQGWVPSFGASVMSNSENWLSSSYKSLSGWYNETTNQITSGIDAAWSTVTSPFKSMAQSWANAWGAGGSTAPTQVVQAAQNQSAQSGGGAAALNMAGSIAKVLSGGMKEIASSVLESVLGPSAAAVESALFGSATGTAAGLAGASYTGPVAAANNPSAFVAPNSGMVGTVATAFAVYQIAVLVGHLITQCKSDEIRFFQDRNNLKCFWVGDYCSSKFLGVCLERKHVGCCYSSPLERIIMQQLLLLQPNLISSTNPGYGDPKNPNCTGLTPQQVSMADFSKVDFSEWLAILRQEQINPPETNTQAKQVYRPENVSHNTGLVDENNAPTTNAKIFSGQD